MKREQQANSLDRPDRRTVLAGSLAATAAAPRAWSARPRRPGVRPVYVQVFLRGGMDGLTAVVPYADGELYSWRPTLAIRPPGFPNGALDIDGFFGFAPCTARLQTPFAAGHMAIVHAAGSSDPTRSHFDSFQRIEFGDANLPLGLVHDGWVARYLAATAASARGPLRAIAMHDFLPYSLTGARNALPIPDVRTFALPGRLDTAALRVAVLEETFGRRRQPVGPAGIDTLASIALLDQIDFASYVPANGAQYPATVFGQRMRDTAALIKADLGVEVILLDLADFDQHAALGPVNGTHAALLEDFSRSCEAFYLDMLAHLDEYVLVGLTEFGRRLIENGSAGTDHGHGSAMFLMGGNVLGGQVAGVWPGLGVDELDSGDLAITTEYRDVIGEVLVARLGLADPTGVFPQHTFRFPGLIA